MFRFAYPENLHLLWLAIVFILLFILFLKKKKQQIKKIGNPSTIKLLTKEVSHVALYMKFFLFLLAYMAFVFILARPQLGSKLEKVKNKGIEVMIALDVSNSMLAEDIFPNRLERAKQIVSKLADDLDDSKMGLIIFAGDAFVQLPITSDFVSAKMFLSTITPDLIANQGTAIGAAIDLASNSFSTTENIGRAIILITDGEDHEDNALKIVEDTNKKGIVVHVLGVGSPAGAPIPLKSKNDFLTNRNGEIVVSKLNESMCQNIAKKGKGIYLRADYHMTHQVLMKELEKITSSKVESKSYSEYSELYIPIAWIVLLLLVIEFFISNKKNKRLRKLFNFTYKNKK